MNNQEKITDPERLVDLYIAGRLDQNRIDDLWGMLIEDNQLYDYLKTSVSLRNVLRSETIPHVPDNIKRNASEANSRSTPIYNLTGYLRPGIVAAAAVFMVAAILSIGYLSSDTSEFQGPPQMLQHEIFRSTTVSGVERIQDAVNYAIRGDASTALIMLNQVLDESSNANIRAEALINMGIIHYNTESFATARVAFIQAKQVSGIDVQLYEKAIWNLSQTLLAMGDTDQARIVLNEVISLDGAHSRAASGYLKYLR